MKISELPNAPAWLTEAETENADVEYSDYGHVVWRGGVWRGGVWHAGEWRGGVWHDGVWHDEKLKNNLLTVFGLRWPATISDTRMQIGCELHAFDAWRSFDDAKINSMDRHALKFWRQHKEALLALCALRAQEPASSPAVSRLNEDVWLTTNT